MPFESYVHVGNWGLKRLLFFSEADQEALHVKMADEAYCVGPTAAPLSYLNFTNIMSVATLTEVDAIHPGYGFLAENADFAEICGACNITFIGPSPSAINRMGTKDVARATMEEAGVPIVPGSKGLVGTYEEALQVAEEIGFPVIIKATAGGGGKGIRVAHSPEELQKGINITQQEAETSFGNPGVYLEKYIENFRHVEIQVLADNHGNVVHLGERDCSIQRRLQKLVEETPSPAISTEKRAEMGAASVAAAKAVEYSGAGTVEFIFDHHTGHFYFMEMNTRIQVEHPVTEMVTGIDLIKEQIKVANGERLSFSQEDITFNAGRLNAGSMLRIQPKTSCPHPEELLNICLQAG